MKQSRLSSHGCRRLLALILAGTLPGFTSAQAGETLPDNSAFDSGAPGWAWENWSAAGSAASYDSTQNSAIAGGAAKSGSLRLKNTFTDAAGYQQAVFTQPLPAPVSFSGQIGFVSFDVRVDPASVARAGGDFGWLEVILRQGNNWDWVTLPGVRLNGNDWQRVTFPVPKGGVDSIRALSVKLGESDLLGPVTLNIDNLAYGTTPDDVLISGFDNGVVGEGFTGWSWESWSTAGASAYETPDTHGRSTSGTIKLEHNFENKPADYQQTVFTYVLPGGQVDAAKEYSWVNVDVKVDAASVPRASGDYGYFELILRNGAGWDWISTEINGASGVHLADNEWHHLSFKINKTASAVHRLTFKVGENALLGPVILHVDNLTFTRNTTPPPPPVLSLAPAQAGLKLVTTSSDQYGRHNLYTTDDDGDPGRYAFSGSTKPVSYSFVLGSFPDAASYPGFQAHIFLVPGTPGTETSPDWNEPTIIFMDIKAAAGNSGTATFRLKTDQAGGNSELYANGLTTVQSATVVGKWTLTANGNIMTMTAPDGTVSAPIDIGAEAAGLFAGTDGPRLRAYFGVQPNAEANKGQSARVSKIEITRGDSAVLSDSFSGDELDTTRWTPNAAAGGVRFVAPADAGYVVSWTLPDSGFVLQGTGGLSPTDWKVIDVTPITLGQNRQAVVPKGVLPAGSQAFLRLFQVQP